MNPAATLLSVIPEGDSVGEILSGAGLTILIGLVVVFAALIVLVLIFWLFGKLVHREEKPAVPAQKAAVSAPVAPAAVPAPVPGLMRGDGISDEVVAVIAAAVAVIAAAVAAMAPEGKRYAIRQVQRATRGRSAWAAAGIAENTQPF